MPEEKDRLQEQLQIERDRNIDLKFETLNNKLDEAITLLKENMVKHDLNKESIRKLEERQRNCPVTVMKTEMKRYSKETSFLRGLFKNPIIGTMVVTLWIIFIFGLLITFGPDSLVEFLMKFKGI